MNAIDIAFQAVRMYAEAHPRPGFVNLLQAAEMLSVSVPTVRKMIRTGKLKRNERGLIPSAEIDRVLSV